MNRNKSSSLNRCVQKWLSALRFLGLEDVQILYVYICCLRSIAPRTIVRMRWAIEEVRHIRPIATSSIVVVWLCIAILGIRALNSAGSLSPIIIRRLTTHNQAVSSYIAECWNSRASERDKCTSGHAELGHSKFCALLQASLSGPKEMS